MKNDLNNSGNNHINDKELNQRLSQKEIDFLNQIKKIKQNSDFFTIKIEYNGKVIDKKSFATNLHDKQIIKRINWDYLLLDFSKAIRDKVNTMADARNKQ